MTDSYLIAAAVAIFVAGVATGVVCTAVGPIIARACGVAVRA